MQITMYICDDCKNSIDPIAQTVNKVMRNGEERDVCDTCINNYRTCDGKCGYLHHESDMTKVEVIEGHMCQHCLDLAQSDWENGRAWAEDHAYEYAMEARRGWL